jgi:amino-acid N-acetyltransferase
LYVHNLAISIRPHHARPAPRPHLSATHAVRQAHSGDVEEIRELLAPFVARGDLLARSGEEIAAAIGDYVVVVDAHERVRACAAIVEYSPSLGEVASVAVAESAQGEGLGTLVVRAVEQVARRRGLRDLFAVSSARRFFESLGYRPSALREFPEKLARYAALTRRGIAIRPRDCFRKTFATG